MQLASQTISQRRLLPARIWPQASHDECSMPPGGGGNSVLPKPLRGKRSRRGLTLLELVVVLTILVALAGILVPMVSNLLPLASTSAGATNAAEVEKLVQLYLTVPQSSAAGQNVTVDLLDNIVSAETSQLMTYVPINSAATPPDIVPYTLTAPVVASLNSLGIRNVYQLVENPNPGTNTPPWNPTFFPYTPTYAQNSTAAMPASEPAVRRHDRRVVDQRRGRAEVRCPEHGHVRRVRAGEIQRDVGRGRLRPLPARDARRVQSEHR